ncbi:tyrosine-type recombinase/integrase [Puniceicoccus vermicola]|uniref:Tyr recombinase domain-containing protein n=1 Tax=Puniceicoccus vermicola TaxID=388746 RepID=A0A7X1AXN5_9BACT|nr:hypothetical protein [Puniceicoccus vermicola]MBC2601772.1 hypothetical protein [Puniceicoccus vermicola]
MKKSAARKRAPKARPLTPVFDQSKGRWRISIPAAKSPTGKRQRLFFDTKRAADVEAGRIKGMADQWGTAGRKIKASLAEDAARASEILEPYGVTLTEVALEYSERENIRNASMPMRDLWKRYEDHLETATNSKGRAYSPRTIQTKRSTAKKIAEVLDSALASDVSQDDIEEILRKDFSSASSRNTAILHAKPMFSYAIRTLRVATNNPFDGIPKFATAQKGISIATPEQVIQAIKQGCQDHTKNTDLPEDLRLDCNDARSAVAILAFAGLRPEVELGNLYWNAIDLHRKTIRVRTTDSKTRSGRYVDIENNLLSWLKLIPAKDRQGKVAPSNWKRKWRVIRRFAGFERADADVLRHSYATYYHRGINGSVDALRANLGHGTTDVTFGHYLDTDVEKAQALRYWTISPEILNPAIKAITI